AVLHAHVLVLVAIVLHRLDEARRGIAALEKGQVVAATQEAIGPRDQLDGESRHVALADLLQMPAELVRRRVVLAARARDLLELWCLAVEERRQPVGEEAHAMVVTLTVRSGRAADDVVADHAGAVEALLL